jgi:hypothetical protein
LASGAHPVKHREANTGAPSLRGGVGDHELGQDVGPTTGSSEKWRSQTVPSANVFVTPESGDPSTSVDVSGGGFGPGEEVNVTYKTGLASPSTVAVCNADAVADGTYSCTGDIPSAATAGADGTNSIEAKDKSTLAKAKTTFTLS